MTPCPVHWPSFLRNLQVTETAWNFAPVRYPRADAVPWMPFPLGQYVTLLTEAMMVAPPGPMATGAAEVPGQIRFLDVGCVDGDSEYLSPSGWRRIADYDGGLVMQYDPGSGLGSLVQPERYIVRPCSEFYELHSKYGINQRLSADHRVLFWKITGTGRRLVPTVWSAERFAAEHARLANGVKGRFQATFTPVTGTKVGLSDEQIRVQVMVNADGWLRYPSNAVLKFRKHRKVLRARALLEAAGIPYRERPDGPVETRFSFTPPWPSKSYERFWAASAEQLRVIAEECVHWDGSTGNGHAPRFFTRSRAAADFIQYAFTASGYRAVLRETHRTDGRHDGSADFIVIANPNAMTGMEGSPKTDIGKVPSTDGLAYCFTLPSGYWVMRRGGNIVMTGNCGPGTKVRLAEAMFGVKGYGIDIAARLVAEARAHGVTAMVKDAFELPAKGAPATTEALGYSDFQIVSVNRPSTDQDKLERLVMDRMAPEAVLIAINWKVDPGKCGWFTAYQEEGGALMPAGARAPVLGVWIKPW